MESLNTLASSLDSNSHNITLDQDEKLLTTEFRAAALSITTLYRSSLQASRRAYDAGYLTCLSDVLNFIQQGVSTSTYAEGTGGEEGVVMSVGRVMDWLEARRDAIRSKEEDEQEDAAQAQAASAPMASRPSAGPTKNRRTTSPDANTKDNRRGHPIVVPRLSVNRSITPPNTGATTAASPPSPYHRSASANIVRSVPIPLPAQPHSIQSARRTKLLKGKSKEALTSPLTQSALFNANSGVPSPSRGTSNAFDFTSPLPTTEITILPSHPVSSLESSPPHSTSHPHPNQQQQQQQQQHSPVSIDFTAHDAYFGLGKRRVDREPAFPSSALSSPNVNTSSRAQKRRNKGPVTTSQSMTQIQSQGTLAGVGTGVGAGDSMDVEDESCPSLRERERERESLTPREKRRWSRRRGDE